MQQHIEVPAYDFSSPTMKGTTVSLKKKLPEEGRFQESAGKEEVNQE